MTCALAHLDGSYVLGSLSPADRQEFERHLDTCAECSRNVRELAGLPGLLSRVDKSVLEYEPSTEAVPETLLPALVAEVRRHRRRGFLIVAGAAAASAVVAVGIPVALVVAGDPDGRPSASTTPSETPSQTPSQTVSPSESATEPVPEAMTTVGGAPVRGLLAFESVAWGTKLDLTCTYVKQRPGSEHDYGDSGPKTYEMFVRTDDGHVDQVGTWRAVDGATMHLTAATYANRDEITSVVVRTSEGAPVLRLKG